ncbi:MAG: PHP domain-containing protein, partial [Candidatus Rokuibacteriota bacterium]
MTGSFAHLHLHTQYSILDGAIPIGPLMAHLRANGMEAAAITDHGNLFGAVEFSEAARAAGVRPIIGCEVYVAQTSRFDRDPETGGFNGINHLVLLAMDETGYANLVRLVSKAYLEGFYYKPRIDLELLRAHHEGLLATSGCLSGMAPSAILRGKTREAWERVASFSALFKDRFYLELQRHGIPEQEVVNK